MSDPEELYRRHSAAFDKLHASEKEDELVEKMARVIRDASELSTKRNFFQDCARAALAAARPVIRDEALEEVANLFDLYVDDSFAASAVADHLRKMKEKT